MAADALRRNGGIRGQAAPAPVDPVGPMDPMVRYITELTDFRHGDCKLE